MADKKTQVAKETATDSKYVSRKKELYEKEVVPYLMKHFGYKNINQCPKLVKITINNGLGDIKGQRKKRTTRSTGTCPHFGTESRSHQG